MGIMGILLSDHAAHGIRICHNALFLVGTMGMMFPCVSLVEKNGISVYKRNPAHPAQASGPECRNISVVMRFCLIGSLGHGIS
jgi:hypothetical protein